MRALAYRVVGSALFATSAACTDAIDERSRPPLAATTAEAAATAAASAAPILAPVVCSATETPFDDGCAMLPAGLTAADLLAPGRLGLWNAWSTIAPLAPKSAEMVEGAGLDLSPIGGEAAARPTCDRDGWVVGIGAGGGAGAGRDRGDERLAVHLAWIVTTREIEADLWGSVVGEDLEVRIGAAPPIHFTEVRGGDGKALLDEAAARVRLPRGASPVLVAHRRGDKAGGFFLRLRDPEGAPLRGVRLAPRLPTARCAASDLLDAHATLTPVMDGDRAALAVELAPAFEGLAPDGPPLRLEAGLQGKAPRTPARSEPLDRAALRSGVARARLVVAAPEKGDAPLTIALEGAAKAPVAELRTRSFPRGLHARVARLVASDVADPSLGHHIEVLSRAVASAEKDTAWLEEHTARAEAIASAMAQGQHPYTDARGVIFRAYRSTLDGRLQPYVVAVPPSADRGEPLPVVVVAHGMDRLPEHALRTLIGQAPDEHMTLDYAAKHIPRVPDLRAILVAPWQYGNAGPHALGEADLAAVLDDVGSTWKIDLRRVSITGYSLGGTVAFVAPVRAPGRFAAAAPLCGYPNLMDYKNVRTVPRAPWEPALLAREYVVGMLENAGDVPFHVVHGGKDVPGRSKVVVDRLRDLSQPVVWNLIEDADHDVWSEAYEDGQMIGWLARHRRPAAPRRVRLVTGEYRVDRASWLRMIALDDAAAPALASLDASFDPAAGTLEVATRGVAAFTVERAGLPDARGEPADPGAVRVKVDGKDLGEVRAGEPIVVVRDAAGALAIAPAIPTRQGSKRHGVSGPLEDALFHPLLVVRGTAEPALTEANRLVAEHVATAWGTAAVRYPIVTDVDATEDALRDRSVVLVGGPPSNLLARRWADSLPARFEPGAITVRGKRHEGPDVAVSLIAPRPGDPERVVVLHGSLSERGTLAARHLPRYLPDWVLYDARIASERGGLLFGTRPTLDGGFFDGSWR